MKWCESTASHCRYGDVAGRIFGDGCVIWESSQDDYQGCANVLVALPDGTFAHYEWTYGSCSGCDEWEDRCLSNDQIEQEMRNGMAVFPTVEVLYKYLNLQGQYSDPRIPTVNNPMNGSVPGMLRTLTGGHAADFRSMGGTAVKWMYDNGLLRADGKPRKRCKGRVVEIVREVAR